jgi:hypothetical protein
VSVTLLCAPGIRYCEPALDDVPEMQTCQAVGVVFRAVVVRIISEQSVVALQMQFMLLFSRQGKLRLQKWYVAHPDKLKKKITRELITTILSRKPKMSSFLEWKDLKVVYKR